MAWQFGALRMFGYHVIVADPPWSYDRYSDLNQSKGAADHYETMALEDIQALRVGELARGDCLLLLWATGCMIPDALAAMEAWGFVFKSEIIWRKVTKNGKIRMGTGYRVRTMHEPILVGTIGSPQHHPFPSIFDGVAREHSRKPDEFFDLVGSHVPLGTFKVDLFSRQNRLGWDSWGHESGKFDETQGAKNGNGVEAVTV